MKSWKNRLISGICAGRHPISKNIAGVWSLRSSSAESEERSGTWHRWLFSGHLILRCLIKIWDCYFLWWRRWLPSMWSAWFLPRSAAALWWMSVRILFLISARTCLNICRNFRFSITTTDRMERFWSGWSIMSIRYRICCQTDWSISCWKHLICCLLLFLCLW